MNEPIPLSDYLIVPLEEALVSAAAYLPSIVAALTILFVGTFFAVIFRWFLGKSLKAARFDAFAKRTRLSLLWSGFGVESAPHAVVAKAAFWLLMLVVFTSMIDTLAIPAMKALADGLVGYLPRLVAGILVLALGLSVARRVRRRVETLVEGVEGLPTTLVTTATYWLLLTIVATASLRMLGIDTTLIERLFTIVIGCVGLALALAFGLGGRDRAHAILDRIGDGDEGGEDS